MQSGGTNDAINGSVADVTRLSVCAGETNGPRFIRPGLAKLTRARSLMFQLSESSRPCRPDATRPGRNAPRSAPVARIAPIPRTGLLSPPVRARRKGRPHHTAARRPDRRPRSPTHPALRSHPSKRRPPGDRSAGAFDSPIPSPRGCTHTQRATQGRRCLSALSPDPPGGLPPDSPKIGLPANRGVQRGPESASPSNTHTHTPGSRQVAPQRPKSARNCASRRNPRAAARSFLRAALPTSGTPADPAPPGTPRPPVPPDLNPGKPQPPGEKSRRPSAASRDHPPCSLLGDARSHRTPETAQERQTQPRMP